MAPGHDRPDPCVADDPPRRHGRLLRVGRAARRSVAAGQARSSSAARRGAASCSRRRTRSGPSACARRCRWRRRCGARPTRIVVPPRRDRYEAASAQVFAIFRRYTPLVEALSLDEAFLDVTASRALFGDGEAIARARSRATSAAELELTASAGVAPCKFVAKVASDLRQARRPGRRARRARSRRSSRRCPSSACGASGRRRRRRMRALGFATIGDLARADARDARAAARDAGARRWSCSRAAKTTATSIPDGRREVDRRRGDVRGTTSSRRDAIGATLLEHAARVARRLFATA